MRGEVAENLCDFRSQKPAEAIDHSNHRVEIVKHAPFLRHDGTAEADRRNVQSKLDDKRHHIAEVAVGDRQGCQPSPHTKRRHHEPQSEQQSGLAGNENCRNLNDAVR